MSGLTADDRPQFRQSSQTRPQTERTAPRRTGKSGTYFWQIWSLMSLVWVVMIGAFYWFIHDLPADLTATGQWIRGSLAGDATAMVEASENLGLAARDILGPPALLLVVMLVAGALFRTLRRWSGDN